MSDICQNRLGGTAALCHGHSIRWLGAFFYKSNSVKKLYFGNKNYITIILYSNKHVLVFKLIFELYASKIDL